MTDIVANLKKIQQDIHHCAQIVERRSNEILLLAVSKTHPVEKIIQAYEQGQRQFGENYLQHAIPKIIELNQLNIEWHFIGKIQSNKTRLIAEHFAWVQTLESEKHAQRLNQQRPTDLPPLNICIQVNINEEPQKAGVLLQDVQALAEVIQALPHLNLRGLMAIPAARQSVQQQNYTFNLLLQAYRNLKAQFPQVDTLSMGMTSDMQAAIAHGSTMVRIGTGIFGARES
ncbi:YggS family pyridoxal phosphate-dependent enzyme [Candidatus Albibeggiatoa sp. nov. NOAA]|uniref:YggS family pyridoxal phosphate-dependent enzyme n=1 Tax=Candidatus Albibeggiatoa sp. nov. NOAA TaxID=3162724 RepID=UPI00330483A5|nr:YggS family pyridoxal phosphate-dependent enzyme [Thiotrichaceae bacterium]